VTDFLLAGRYRLTDRIAAGGMGEVWRGFDQLLNRRVAVKLLPTVREGDGSSLARFRAEARYAASLSHSGIARVYDYGESSEFGGAYLVMELVDGDPLSAILARNGRLSPDATLDIIGQAALALDAAHQAGIVHRDIKPGNILIAPGGTAKITDFGIATAVRAAQASHLTQTGMVMGTAMYVSPEQATGAPVTASSDIYSLGVVAFECLAGRPPFNAREPLAIAYAHKHEPVPPLPPDVPAPVADLVRAMLAKTPDGRPASARVVADRANVLRDTLAMGGPPGPPPLPGPFPPPETRADLPAAATDEIFSERPLRATSQVRARHPHRRLLGAGVTVAVCALAAGVSFYLAGGMDKPAGNTGHTQLQEMTTPADPAVVSSTPGPGSPTQSRPNQLPTSPGATPAKKPKPKKSSSPTKPAPTSASASASASSSASASASATSPTTAPPTSSSPTSPATNG
jgi:serine/threonine protein kinase